MRKYTLSPFPYYGGKSRMAGLIADMLDYNNTSMYIEPFGGACRTLLNKPPHQSEIYCDTSRGLCTFFEIVQNEKTCAKLQDVLLGIEPSEIEFWKAFKYKNSIEQTVLGNTTKALKRRVAEIKRNTTKENVIDAAIDLRRAILNLEIENIIKGINKLMEYVEEQDKNSLRQFSETYQMFWNVGKDIYEKAYNEGCEWAESEQIQEYETEKQKEKRINKVGRENAFSALENIEEPPELSVNDSIKLAAATFQTFYFSRDGMGLSYSENRGDDIKAYIKKIDELGDIGRRMKDVKILNINAWYILDRELQSGAGYLMNPNVMMYLDPSYLSVEDRETGKKEGKNLGSSYDSSFDLEQHERLVENIIDAKAKILLSNYDVEPYKSNLTAANGWHRYEYETKTSVGGTRDNKRTEVLWYNY